MSVKLVAEDFDPWRALQQHQADKPELSGKYGATSIFVGTMRDFNEGSNVQGMVLEHYPAMTQRHLQAISAEAMQRWSLLDTLIIHRFGEIRPDEPIVLLAVWSAHRSESFPACRYLIEELKSRAPFWKKELNAGDARWVTHNTPG